jgi:hypothetical protein
MTHSFFERAEAFLPEKIGGKEGEPIGEKAELKRSLKSNPNIVVR